MIDHIDVCLCICKMTILRSSLKCIINMIQIDTCTTEIHFNFYFLRHILLIVDITIIQFSDHFNRIIKMHNYIFYVVCYM